MMRLNETEITNSCRLRLSALSRKRQIPLLLLSFLPGCVDRIMSIDSNPEGALVYLNDQEVGRTPLKHDFQQYGNYQLEVRKEGFETLKSTQQTQEPWWQLVPLDLGASLLPWHFRDTRHYLYSMTPATTKPADPQAMLDAAARYRSMLVSSPNTRLPTTSPTTLP